MPPLLQDGQDQMTPLLPGECAPWESEVRQPRASRMASHMVDQVNGSMWWPRLTGKTCLASRALGPRQGGISLVGAWFLVESF